MAVYIARIKIPGKNDKIFNIEQDSLIIGRLSSSNICINADEVEPIHALLEKNAEKKYIITDLGSDFGVFINDKKIEIESVVNIKDIVKIGQATLSIEKASENKNVIKKKKSKQKLFLTNKIKPGGRVLEAIAYWGDTVLEVDHFNKNIKGYKSLIIGITNRSHMLGFGRGINYDHTLAKVSDYGFTLNLTKDMKARIRKDKKVITQQGPKTIEMGVKDIAHIKSGPIKYFLMNINPPKLNLPRKKVEDPLFFGLLISMMAFYTLMMFYIFTTDIKETEKHKSENIWTVVTLPEKTVKKQKTIEIKKLTKKTKPKEVKPKKLKKQEPKVKKIKKPVKAMKKLTKNRNTRQNNTSLKRENTIRQNSKVKTSSSARTSSSKKIKTTRYGGIPGKGGGAGNKKHASPGINLNSLGAGVGKILSKSGAGAIRTKFASGSGGVNIGSTGNAIKRYGLGGVGRAKSIGLSKVGNVAAKGFGSGKGVIAGSGGMGAVGKAFSLGKGGKRGPADIKVPASDPIVSGGLTEAEIRSTIRKKIFRFKKCFNTLIQKYPNITYANVSTKFIVKSNARVKNAAISDSSSSNSKFKNCIIKELNRLVFPKPRGNSDVAVDYTFPFKSV